RPSWCHGSAKGRKMTTLTDQPGSRRISMRRHLAVAILLVASVHPQVLAKEVAVEWAVNATIIDGCSCQMLCPCIFGSPATVGSAPTHGDAGTRSRYFKHALWVNTWDHHDG